MSSKLTTFVVLALLSVACPARDRQPVIDMHLHARKGDYVGEPLPPLCLPVRYMPRWDPALPIETGVVTHAEPACKHPLIAVTSATQLMRETLALMEKRNVIGMVTGEPDVIATWKAAAAGRVIAGSDLRILRGSADGRLKARTPDELRALHEQGLLEVLGEVMAQYEGITPNDERLEPYWALAESLDVPVGIHMGPGTPGDPYLDGGRYRARNSSPLALEDVLVRHPRLRVYVMHAGYPFIDDLRALMYTHPQVYVDIAAIVSGEPRPAFYAYIKELVDAGFGDRILFGTDQGLWPGLITESIDVIERAPFLTKAQKRDILYNNAARFLRLSKETIARHHAM
ncbi:MAG TPA: amidohydrolase family protein [Steroidobacteraceae bacterium]|nr:amidohydrolase family protein [Steroidobacteraceae bacterium]